MNRKLANMYGVMGCVILFVYGVIALIYSMNGLAFAQFDSLYHHGETIYTLILIIVWMVIILLMAMSQVSVSVGLLTGLSMFLTISFSITEYVLPLVLFLTLLSFVTHITKDAACRGMYWKTVLLMLSIILLGSFSIEAMLDDRYLFSVIALMLALGFSIASFLFLQYRISMIEY